MMKRLLAALLFMLPGTAWATCSSVPYTFTPNTLAQSGQVNANFAALVNCANTIDAGQIVTGVLPVARGGTNNPTWTTGSVVFATASTQLGQDNSNLFWDSTNHRLGIGTNTPTQMLEVNGPIKSSGGGAGFLTLDQSTSGTSAFYRSGGITAFNDNVFGNVILFDNAGHVAIDTTPNASFQLTVNGTVNTTLGYFISTHLFASNNSTYSFIYNPTDGTNADIVLGGSGDATNYYRNTAHVFGNIGGGTTYASLNASTFTVNVATLAANTITATGNISTPGTVSATTSVLTGVGGSVQTGHLSSNNEVACAGTGFNACLKDNSTGDSINNYSAGVWAFFANGGGTTQILTAQLNTQSPSTSGSGTACLVGGTYFAGYQGVTNCASDERLKTIGDPLIDSLSLIDQLKPVNFTWKDGVENHPRADEALHAGLVAQDVKKLMPACVTKNPDDYLGLDTYCLIAYLAKAIQELDAKVSSK